jgi:hypothetical protein
MIELIEEVNHLGALQEQSFECRDFQRRIIDDNATHLSHTCMPGGQPENAAPSRSLNLQRTLIGDESERLKSQDLKSDDQLGSTVASLKKPSDNDVKRVATKSSGKFRARTRKNDKNDQERNEP